MAFTGNAMNAPGAAQWIAENDSFPSRAGHRIAFRRKGVGPTVLMLHGFPTWSYDFAEVAADLSRDHDVITLDFLGYGASDKPRRYRYSVSEAADTVEDLLAFLEVTSVLLLVHDYGVLTSQELVDRDNRRELSFTIERLTMLNAGIIFSAYHPTRLQKLLIRPVVGSLLAACITATRVRGLLDAVREITLTDDEFDELWLGVSRSRGHKLWHLLIKYNAERQVHHQRWEAALAAWTGPIHLVWGVDDPVSGRQVLELATQMLPRAAVTALTGVGHYPHSEVPQAVAGAVRSRE